MFFILTNGIKIKFKDKHSPSPALKKTCGVVIVTRQLTEVGTDTSFSLLRTLQKKTEYKAAFNLNTTGIGNRFMF